MAGTPDAARTSLFAGPAIGRAPNVAAPGGAWPGGLRLVRDHLAPEAQAALLARIDAHPWSDELKRRVQHHGWRYDYRARRVSHADRIGPLPAWLEAEAARLVGAGGFAAPPDQVIANEYLPGQGIAAHVDCEPCFGETIASLSLGSTAVMQLRELDGPGRVDLVLEPGSLLVLTGAARHDWTHAIPARLGDRIDGARRMRGRRVSLTFRTVRAATSRPADGAVDARLSLGA